MGFMKIFLVSPYSMSRPRNMKAVLSETRAACCMLCVTMTMEKCSLELGDEILDARRGDGVERRAGLVHQDDFGLGRDRARDAQALLLAAGEAERVVLEAVGHLVPERGVAQGALAGLLQQAPVAHAVHPQGIDDVLEDGHREGVGLLEHHAEALAELDDLDARVVNLAAVDEDGSLAADAVDEVVHPVERAQKGGLPAARGADEGGDELLLYLQAGAEQGLLPAVPEAEVLDVDDAPPLALDGMIRRGLEPGLLIGGRRSGDGHFRASPFRIGLPRTSGEGGCAP